MNKEMVDQREKRASNIDEAVSALIVIESIYKAGQRLQSLINKAEDTLVDTHSPAKLSEKNFHSHCDECRRELLLVDHRDTKSPSVNVASEGNVSTKMNHGGQDMPQQWSQLILELSFLGMKQAEDSTVPEIDPFSHWGKSNGQEKYLTFEGLDLPSKMRHRISS